MLYFDLLSRILDFSEGNNINIEITPFLNTAVGREFASSFPIVLK